MIFYNIPWIIPHIGELVHTYKYGLLVYKARVFVLVMIIVLSPVLPPSLIRLQPIQLRLLKSYTLISSKAIVLVSLPLDLITLLAPALSGFFIPNTYLIVLKEDRNF